MMNNPAFLVEGDLEQKFVQNVCPGAPVKKINCNGDETRLDAIAKRVGSLARLLHKKHKPIIIVFDREGRAESSSHIESNFINLMKAENIDVPIIVGIPDRSIETWILADFQQFLTSIGGVVEHKDQNYEGKCGKAAIKRLLPPDGSYVETIEGVAWLKASRPDIIIRNSVSFRNFALPLRSLQCWWLRELHLEI